MLRGSRILFVLSTALAAIASVLAAPAVATPYTCHLVGPQAYVANAASQTVSVISNCDQVTDTVNTGMASVAIAVNPVSGRIYVANADGTVSVIDPSDDMVIATIPVGVQPAGIAVNPAGTRVYVTNQQDSTVSVIDTAQDPNFVLVTFSVGSFPMGVAFGRNGTRAYVADENSASVSVIDAGTSSVADTVFTGGNPSSVVVSPDGSAVYVEDTTWADDNGDLSVIDTATNTITDSFDVKTMAFTSGTLAISPDGGTVYAADFPDKQILAVSTVTDTVTATIPVKSSPTAVAVTRDGIFGYIVEQGVSTISKFSTNSNLVIKSIGVGSDPQYVATLPSPPPFHGARWFHGVSCVNPGYCLAVGVQEAAQGDVALAEVRSAGHWRLTEPVSLPGALDTSLQAVSCRTVTDCVAVGTAVTLPATGGPASSVPLAAAWNGSQWAGSRPPLPAGARGGELRTVSCGGRSGCIAAGSYETSAGVAMPLSERWTGRSWQLLSTPDARRARAGLLNGVSCRASNCAAAGASRSASGWGPLALSATGTSWLVQRMQAVPGRSPVAVVKAVSCARPRECMAVGFASVADRVVPFTERLASGKWTLLTLAARTPANSVLDSVSCTAASRCVATGATTGHGKDSPLAEAWNGSRWRILKVTGPLSPTLSVLDQVSCTRASFCLAVGNDGSHTLAEQWNGTTWRVQTTPG